MSREDALRFLKKNQPKAFDLNAAVEALSTGSLAVDMVTGIGGFPRGRLTEVFGWEASGKTTLCLMACAEAQRQGFYPAYIDTERGVDLALADKIGFIHNDTDKGLYITPDTFEQTVKAIDALASSDECHLVIADSVPAMVPAAELEKGVGEGEAIGARARQLAAELPKLTKVIAEKNVALVLVNQMRQKIQTGWAPSFMQRREDTEQSSGGSALKFYSSLRLDMKQVKRGYMTRKEDDLFTGKEKEVPTANLHHVRAFKNKVATPYREATFMIRYDGDRDIWGIDNLFTVMAIAITKGIIEKSGSFFKVDAGGKTVKVQGEEALYDYLLRQSDVADGVRERVYELDEVKRALRRA